MKRTVTAMRALSVLVLALLFAVADVAAQNVPHIFMFESLEADTTFFSTYGGTPENPDDRPKLDFAEYPGDPYEGEGALMVDWRLFTDQDWGGSMGIMNVLPEDTTTGEPQAYYDFSDFTHIHLHYNTLVSADPETFLRLKLHDASLGLGSEPSSETEDWYSESDQVFQGEEGVWREFIMPLEVVGTFGDQSVPEGGFSRPGCTDGADPTSSEGCWSGLIGNQQLDLDKIAAFTLEFTTGQIGAGDSTTSGTIAFDAMYASGVRYNLLNGFESADAVGSWDNGDGSHTLTAVDDTVQGTGAVELDYHVVGSLDWGGSTDLEGTPVDGTFEDMSARTHLSLFYKVTEPITGSGGGNFTFKLFDDDEQWHYTASGVLDDTTGTWQRLLLPLDEFAIPSWETTVDGELNMNAISSWQLQVGVGSGADVQGSILLDRLTGYGFQLTDFEAPAQVQDVSAMASSFQNIVSWTDVPDEDGETYTVYFSEEPITDVSAKGVMVAEVGIEEGNEAYVHDLYWPVEDTDVSFYYAVTATDAAGNSNTDTPGAAASHVSNTARGLPTISMTPPASWAADGDVSEWSSHTPLRVGPSAETFAHVPTGDGLSYQIDGESDLSANAYFAVDDEAIYVAFEVTDDAVYPTPAGGETNRWLYDGIELYLGMYDWRGEQHQSYQAAEEPDYQINFYSDEATRNGLPSEADSLYHVDHENYSFDVTDTGYIIEAKLPFAHFKHDTAPDFTPVEGMRIPMDFVFMDNDLGGEAREGLLAYSLDNFDNSYQSPSNWFYNWIGAQAYVATDAEEGGVGVPDRFALHQNYPNPFNPSTLIRYELPQASEVTIRVFNVLGQQVRTLVEERRPAGVYDVRFEASDLSSGVYFYHIKAGDFVQSKKMVLIR